MFWNDILRWIVTALSLRQVAANVTKGFLIGFVLFFIIYCLERHYGARTDQYRSRSFFHDALYWLWVHSGLNRLVFTSAILGFFTTKLSVLQLHPLNSLAIVPRYIVYVVIIDFLAYWIHRWRHTSHFMWAFHTTHHSQEKLSFATV